LNVASSFWIASLLIEPTPLSVTQRWAETEAADSLMALKLSETATPSTYLFTPGQTLMTSEVQPKLILMGQNIPPWHCQIITSTFHSGRVITLLCHMIQHCRIIAHPCVEWVDVFGMIPFNSSTISIQKNVLYI
jgi:hypothetical protein